MIGIAAVAGYLPEKRVDNIERLDGFEIDREFVERKTGMLSLAVRDNHQETSDLCVCAYHRLKQACPFDNDEVECLIVCTQNPDGYGLPHTSAIVHGKLGLKHQCAAFDISLGCSGYVYGLSVILSFMQANRLRKGILITADPYSKIIDKSDKNTSLLFGDGASATLISDRFVWQAGQFVFGTDGGSCEAIHVDDNQKLNMNGRTVFNFSVGVVPKSLMQMLELNNLGIEDIDCILLHQGSRYVVETIARRLKTNPNKIPFRATHYGNTVSSSIPMLLEVVDPKYKTVVIAGFGVGLSWGTTLLKRVS